MKPYRQKAAVSFLALPAILAFLVCFAFPAPVHAVTTIPYKMNFQGRLTDASGNPMAAGSYNMKFRIYDASSGGTLKWSEQRANSASTGVTVTTGGLFSVQLGDVSSLPANIFSTTDTAILYFEIELPTPATATCTGASCESYTEGPMAPRNKLASSAYSFNSDLLDGLDSSAFAQTASNTAFTGTLGVSVSNAAAFTVGASGTNILTVDTASSQVKIGTADATTQVLVLDSNTADPGAVAGGIYYNSSSSKFRCYQGGWVDCVTAAGGATLQAAYDGSGTPATITTTAAKGVSIVAGAAPTADLLVIDNTANPTTTAAVDGVNVKYAGGAAAVEGAGMRVDYTPGSTSGGIWSGIRIVANATGPVSGVSAYGIKLEGPTAAGAGTEEGMYIGTGWDIGVDIQSGGIQLATQNDPAAPAANNLRIYAKDIAGRVMPKWIGPAGVDTPMQAGLGFNRVSMVMPAGGSTLTTFVGGFGTTFTNTGTAANPTPTSTNLLTSVRRATYSTGTTPGTVASHRQSVLQVWRGNAAGRGGFFFTIRFGTSTLQTGNRAFVGLSSSVAAPTNIDPFVTGTIGRVGVAVNTNTGNWSVVTNTVGSTPTATNLGSTMPLNTTDLYELILYSPPNGSTIGYRMKNLSTDASVSGSLSSNLPSSTTFLSPQFWITNNATGAAAILDFSGWYLESDV
ncbi:MAG TPA: hypothetical protein PKV96_02790 [Candidatus Saccharimonas sp.]|nr:hypothetical protein [Candidatus Saccharimonas sp.]